MLWLLHLANGDQIQERKKVDFVKLPLVWEKGKRWNDQNPWCEVRALFFLLEGLVTKKSQEADFSIARLLTENTGRLRRPDMLRDREETLSSLLTQMGNNIGQSFV